MFLRGAVVQLGARNTGSVEVTGSSPVSSTIFMYRLLAAVLILLLTLPAISLAQKGQANTQPAYVPDVVVIVFSGITSVDVVSCTYSKVGTTKAEAENDVRILESITQAKFNEVNITSKALEPSNEVQTSSEFHVNGFVNYNQGGLVIEPFIQAFKRFKNIEVDYIINGNTFQFKGLRDYNDKYVTISFVKPYQYRVVVNDPGFTSLNLPITVQTPQDAKQKTGASAAGRPKLLVALGIALFAGVAVYFGTRKFSKTTS